MAHAIQGKETAVSPGGVPCSPRRRRGIKPNVDARSRRQTVRGWDSSAVRGFLVVVGPDRQERREALQGCPGVLSGVCCTVSALLSFLYFYSILSYSVVR